MRPHYMKDNSVWEALIHPMDSFTWNDIGMMRQYMALESCSIGVISRLPCSELG